MALAFVGESLVSGRQTVRRICFMLVGDGLAGKTRVAAALLNAQGGNHPDVAITSRRMGIGCSRLQLHSAHGGAIDAQVCGTLPANKCRTFRTRSTFPRAVVCICSCGLHFCRRRWTGVQRQPLLSFASADAVTRPVLVWMKMLLLHVPDAQFVMCGTHASSGQGAE